MDTIDYAIRRRTRASRLKAMWNDTFDQCYRYALPQREGMFESVTGRPRTDDIFDETAVVGLQEFANRIQAGLTPAWQRFAQLEPGATVPPDQADEVKGALDTVNDVVFQYIHGSNFSSQMHEAVLDLGVGTGALRFDYGDASTPFRFTAIPLSKLEIDTGPFDTVDGIFWQRCLLPSQLLKAYPGSVLTTEQLEVIKAGGMEQPLHFIEAVWRDWDEGKETWKMVVYSDTPRHVYREKTETGFGSNPFLVFRWSVASGEVWGRGPLMTALPAIKTANAVVEMVLQNAQLAIAGMYNVEDDGVVNIDTLVIEPGLLVGHAAGSKGMQPIAPAGNFDVSELVLGEMRTNIKRALYNEMLRDPEKTPPSATQVSYNYSDLAQRIGAALGRLQNELADPLVRRALRILRDKGYIKLPSLGPDMVRVRVVSPLVMNQNGQDVQQFTSFAQIIAGIFGPQMVNLLLKQEVSATWLADKMGIDNNIVRTKAELTQAVQQMAQMAQQAQQSGMDMSGIMGGSGGGEEAEPSTEAAGGEPGGTPVYQ